MKLTPEDLIRSTPKLPSLPEVVMRALDLAAKPDTSILALGRVIAEDAPLAARLLRIVNSPYYGLGRRVDSVPQALTVIGMQELMNLLLATGVLRAFQGLPCNLVDMARFWRHSLYCAVFTRALARNRGERSLDRYFAAGLLHEVGALVLYIGVPELAREALNQARHADLDLCRAETAVIGFDHAAAGSALLTAWHLPEPLIMVTAHHHNPAAATEHHTLVATVHLADLITGALITPSGATDQAPTLDGAAWDHAGFTVEILPQLISDADAEFAGAEGLLMG
jgi:HD-like signal output (HDOD) protein